MTLIIFIFQFTHFYKAFLLIDRGSFHRLIKYCQPSISDSDIPHRTTLCADILRRALIAEEKVQAKLKSLPCKVSFTFDAWTSQPGDPYLSITGHYIDAPAGHPKDWELKTEQLSFEEIKGRHTGKNMAAVLRHTIDQYQIHGKVSCFKNPKTLWTLIWTTVRLAG
jgi:hypothetical protein